MTTLLGSLTELPTAAIVLFKMTLLLGAGWVLHFALVRRNPRWRVLVWRGVMAGMILLPVGELLLPKLQIAVAPPPSVEEPITQAVTYEPVTPVQSDDYVAPVAPVPVSSPREPFLIFLWAKQHPSFLLLTGWGLISLILAVRVICVTHRVRRVVRASEPAPERIRRLMEKVAEDLRCRIRVDLRVTAGLGSPFLAGVIRPVLVLPERMTDERHAGELPAVFAHELAHLHAHDLIWIAAGKWLAVLWWFHPLAWTARAAYIGSCEEVCDAVAADYVGGAPSYLRTLARAALELVVDAPAPAPGGIPMIRTSDITRRLRNLKRGIKAAALARRRVVAGILLGCATLVVLGCLQLVRAGHRGTAESPSSEKQLKKLTDDFAYNGKINTPIPSTFDVDFDVIVSVLATQENLLKDIDCSFSAVDTSNETGEVRYRYEGSWRYDTGREYQWLSVSYFDGDEKNPNLLQLYAYDGEEMREWSDSNNSGNFSTEPLNSGFLSFPFGPHVLSRHPLRQEAPLLTYSEFLSAKELPGIQEEEPVQPTILGWEKLRLAEGKMVETIIIDVAIKSVSFKVKMWLDPRKQFLPRRIVHYTPDDYDSTYHGPIVDIVTDEYKEIGTPDGPVFVPVKGRVAGISTQENKYASTTRILVDRIAINQGLSPDDYRFEWPDGARILNVDNNDWGYIRQGRYVPGRAYEAAEEAKEAAESNESNQAPEAEGYTFGPVIERWINDDDAGEDFSIDFDTGRLWDLYPGRLARGMVTNFDAYNIDAFVDVSGKPKNIICSDMVVIAADNVWDGDPAAIVQQLRFGRPGSPIYMSAEGELPKSFIFKTCEFETLAGFKAQGGAMGVLQILELSDRIEPRGVRIRYKMIQRKYASVEANESLKELSQRSAPSRPSSWRPYYIIERSEWQNRDLYELIEETGAKVTPACRDGRIEGLRLENIAENKYAKELRLEEGDIVRSVNGVQIRSIDEAADLAVKLQRAPVVRVEVLRGGNAHTLTYRLR